MKSIRHSIFRIIVFISCIGFSANSFAGETYRNLFAEFFGASGIMSANYDQRFYSGCKFGFRAGIGWACPRDYAFSSQYDTETNLHGVAFPVGVNFMTGRARHKFEVGVNLTPGIYNCDRDIPEVWDFNDEGEKVVLRPYEHIGGTVFNMALSINLGYRYQRPSGFMFRAGWSPQFISMGKYPCISWGSLIPYLSFGYTLK